MPITLKEYREWVGHHLKLHHHNANFVTADEVDTWFEQHIQPLAGRADVQWLRDWSSLLLKSRGKLREGESLGDRSRREIELRLRMAERPRGEAPDGPPKCCYCRDTGFLHFENAAKCSLTLRCGLNRKGEHHGKHKDLYSHMPLVKRLIGGAWHGSTHLGEPEDWHLLKRTTAFTGNIPDCVAQGEEVDMSSYRG